ncbi:MAG: DMT family transporter [Ilumatobacteraceae bacterium]
MGVFYILVSGAAFGLLPWFARIAYDHGSEPFGMLFGRFVIATTIMFIIRFTRKRHEPRPPRKIEGQLFSLGAIGYAPQASFFFFGVDRIDISLATVIFYSYPVFVVLASWLVFHHQPSRATIVCLAVAVAGTALTAGQVKTGSWTGVAFMLAAAIWYSGYIVVSSKVVHYSGAFISLTYVMLGAATVHTFIYVLTQPSLPHDRIGWIAIGAASIVSTILAMGFFFAGVSRIGPGESAVLSTIEPVVSIAIGVTLLNEELTALRFFGALLVLVGVAVLAQLSRADTK